MRKPEQEWDRGEGGGVPLLPLQVPKQFLMKQSEKATPVVATFFNLSQVMSNHCATLKGCKKRTRGNHLFEGLDGKVVDFLYN